MSVPEAEYRARLVAAAAALEGMRAELDRVERERSEPIAILGLGCRIPGGGDTPEAFWALLEGEVDAVTEVPADRYRPSAPPPGAAPDKRGVRWGAFLKGIDRFDPQFFGISPREAASLDPQQRLLLEVSWEALERAGQVPERLVGSRTGVFIGLLNDDYKQVCAAADPEAREAHVATGNSHCFPPGRLAYVLGLQGPAMTVDTACSSSLVAVHLACRSLRSKESDLALAGGVNVILSPYIAECIASTGALSPDGRCKTFDAQANGFVRGEGCGMLVLKRLSDAQADGDTVLALIRGSAVNQDGRSTGFTAPNVRAQQALIRQALEDARVAPSDISYVEAHGTGTSLGDPIEVEALVEVLGAPRADGATCALGALKTNVGHLESAAGVAGIIKVVLAMQHQAIPANLHFRQLNPRISLEGTALVIPTEKRPWRAGERPRFAGVSSFGMSGTNAHVVLQDAPRPSAAPAAEEALEAAHLLPLSAHSPAALAALVRACQAFLAGGGAGASARDIAYTASVRRGHHAHRLAVVGRTREELSEALAAALRDAPPAPRSAGGDARERSEVVFVFSGQGSPWPGMGRELLATEPVFRDAIERCDALLRRHGSLSLVDELSALADRSRLARTDVAQPALFAVQVALVELWRSWGVAPGAVVGHSVGEVAAAWTAGALTLEDAIAIVHHRGRLMQQAEGAGRMAAVAASAEQAARALAPYGDRVAIAAINDPGSVVLSGDPAALEEVLATLAREGAHGRPLRVDYAFHSPQMERFQPELTRALAAIAPRRAAAPMFSTVTGAIVSTEKLGPGYWADNLRRPVQLAGAIDAAIADGYRLFLEIGPHPILVENVAQCLAHRGVSGCAVGSLRRQREERRAMLESLAALYARGRAVAWRSLFKAPGRCVPLPPYPWQRERFWVEPARELPAQAAPTRASAGAHPLLGARYAVPTQPGAHFWERALRQDALPYLADHRVQGAVVLPGAAYVELALAAAAELRGAAVCAVDEVAFERMLTLPAEGAQVVHVVVSDDGPGRAALQVFSRPERGAEGNDGAFTRHATARLRWTDAAAAPDAADTIEAIRQRCATASAGAELYRELAARGLSYGPAFQGLEQLFVGAATGAPGRTAAPAEALGRIRVPEAVAGDDRHRLHPAALDACLHALVALFPGEGALVPVAIERVVAHGRLGRTAWAHAVRRGEELTADVAIRDDRGALVAELRGLRIQRLDQGAAPRAASDGWLHRLVFRRQDRAPASAPRRAADGGAWLVFCDRGGVGAALAALLRGRGERCVQVVGGDRYLPREPELVQIDPARPEDYERLLRDALRAGEPCRGAIHLFGLDAVATSDTDLATLAADQQLGCLSALSLAQALLRQGSRDAARLWLATRGAVRASVDDPVSAVSQAPLWGFGRALALEHPELACTLVDLASAPAAEQAQALALELELDAEGGETQIALRPEGRFVARLARSSVEEAAAASPLEPARGRPFRLEMAGPNVLSNLTLRAAERRPPGPGEVEIEVEAAGLNFLDVLLALGVLPDDVAGAGSSGPRLGGECAGRIVAVGPGVEGFEPGQEVVAIAWSAFSSFVTTSSQLVAPKPRRISFEEAATLPVAFLTTMYALTHVARLRAGERVLIHAGAGGVGLSAIQWAQRIGAEVLATAGSDEKRRLLRSLGVAHVADSRSLEFADEIRRATGGEGVDVVLNSLSGGFIPASLELLRDHGRFIEIGKRDYYANSQLGLRPFLRNLSFSLVDLRAMMAQRPEMLSALLHELVRLVDEGSLRPLPVRAFPISSAAEAFGCMAQARHVGKIALSLRDPGARVAATGARVAADGTYLIAGGLGGLGLSVASWLVARGARSVVLVGRGEPSARAAEAVLAMERAGARIKVARADISRRDQVAALFADVARSMPPLRGVVHSAAVLDDATVLNLTPERFRRVLAPKIEGAWNLHVESQGLPLDLFVLFSSAATLLGSPGQSNYTAANAFLDALAHARRAAGLPAISVGWGPWAEVGLAAAQANRGERLALRGVDSMKPDEALDVLGRLIERAPVHVGVVPLNARQWLQFHPRAAGSPVLAELSAEQGGDGPPRAGEAALRRALLALPPGAERRALLEAHLAEQLAEALRLRPERVDRRSSLADLGLDSLIFLEVRRRLEVSLGVALPAAVLWSSPDVAGLAEQLALRIDAETEAAPAPPAARPAAPPPADDLDALSEDDVAELLAGELASIKQRRLA